MRPPSGDNPSEGDSIAPPSAPRAWLRRGAEWPVDAAIAGWVLAFAESLRLFAGGGAWAPIVAAGLLLPLALVAGTMALATLTLIGRMRWARLWRGALRRPGPERVRALWRGILVLAVCGATFAITGAGVAMTHGRFNAPGALGLLLATATSLGLIVATILALAADDGLGPRVAALRILTRASTGLGGWLALLLVVAGGAAGLTAAANAAAPAADFRPLALLTVFGVALAASALSGLSRRIPRYLGLGIVAAAVAVSALAFDQIGDRDRARGAIARDGTLSVLVLRGLWSISDGDGDGFVGRFGGSDCDDGDPSIHPDAAEVIGNGIDENCAGGDLTLEDVAHRARSIPTGFAGARRRNVLLISLDAVRADHLGAYGYHRPTSPNLDALAARGARFDWAITPSPSTRRAIPAMMGARYPSTLAFVEGGRRKIWPPRLAKGHHWMLGESFAEAGYQTAAVLCCKNLFDARMGVITGITHVDSTAADPKDHFRGVHMLRRFEAWLRERHDPRKPFFMWMHFIDAHNPYKQPPGAPRFGKRAIDRYDAEIWHVDRKVGEVLALLDARGLLDETIVGVTADHGDEFMEHGNRFHAHSLYNEVARVPLIIAAPGFAPIVERAPVSMIDLGPTLLDLVGIDRPAGLNGRSLGAIVAGGEAPDRMVLSELIADRNITRNLRAGFAGDHKLIWDLDADTYELYSLSSDPLDAQDLLTDEPDLFERLRARLHQESDLELTLLPTDRHLGEPRQRSHR